MVPNIIKMATCGVGHSTDAGTPRKTGFLTLGSSFCRSATVRKKRLSVDG